MKRWQNKPPSFGADLTITTSKYTLKQAEIENHVKRLAYLRSEYTKDKAALRVCTGRLKNLSVRKEKFQTSLAEIEKSLIRA